MVGAAPNAGVFPLARHKSFDRFAGVAGAAAVDFNALAMEHIHCPLSHVARQQDRNASLFQKRSNIRLASTTWRRKHNPSLLNGLSVIHVEKRELGAMAKVVIDVAVNSGGYGNKGIHFSFFFLR